MLTGARQFEFTCMGVKSNGSYGIDSGLFYSFPVMIDAASAGDGAGGGCGSYSIVGGLDLNTDAATHIAKTTNRLRAELDEAMTIDDEMPPVVFDDVMSASSAAEPAAVPVTS